jgi:putative ABC transport system permease protein
MISHFKIILRRSLKNWVSFTINVCGLSVGIAASFIILDHVSFETTYDSQHSRSDSEYRIILNNYASTNAFIGPLVKEKYSEVLDFTRLHRAANDLTYNNVQGEQIKFHEENALWADNSFFDFFSFKLIDGNEKTALIEPNSMVLCETSARKYFGNENPIGHTVTFGNGLYTVTGVLKDLPENTHLKFDILVSLATWEQNNSRPFVPATGLRNSGFFTYIRLENSANTQVLESDMADYLLPIVKKNVCEIGLQPIKDIHLKSSGIKMDMAVIGDSDAMIYLFLAAYLILILAWTNHINLVVYQNSRRLKEYGIKKSFGASNSILTKQIIMETIFAQVLAITVAVIVYSQIKSILDPLFSTTLELDSFLHTLFGSRVMISFFILMVFGVIASLIIPSIVVSNCRIIASLENKIEIIKGLTFRKGILLFQFIIIISLSIISLGIYQQIMFLNSKDYGITIDDTIILRGPRMFSDSSRSQPFNSFKESLLRNSSVESIVISSDIPGKNIRRKGKIANIGNQLDEADEYNFMFVGDKYLDAYGLSILAGSDFSKDNSTQNNIIINKSALLALGYSEAADAIQHQIATFWGAEFTIIAVVNDYHHLTPKYNYEPTIFLPLSAGLPFGVYYSIKLSSHNLTGDDYSFIISEMRETWSSFFPERAFNYYFLEDSYREQGITEANFQDLLFFLTAVSFVLTCLGILGLTSLLAIQKLKEMAIRKVLGASTRSVYLRSLRGVLQLLGISCLFSVPIALFGLGNWLNNYASRIEINLWISLIPIVLIFTFTVLIASFHVLKASYSSPTKILAQ